VKTLTKEEMAEEMAEIQYQWDTSVIAIFRILASDEEMPDEPLKLLAVSEDTIPADAQRGFGYPFAITVITPDKQQRLNTGTLSLPNGWQRDKIVGGKNQREKTAA